jgi:hypothetical protein
MTIKQKDFVKGLPSSFRVAAFDISIEIKDGNWAGTENKWGMFTAIEQKICIQGDMPNKYKFIDTLLHELNHAVWWAYGIEDEDKEERVVGTMATGWTQLYRDNPEFAKWLAKLTC